jgi:hypothetical protein
MEYPAGPPMPTTFAGSMRHAMREIWALNCRNEMIRSVILAFTLSSALDGAELTVFTSAEASKENLVSTSVWYSDGSSIDKEPEQAVLQEGQIVRQVYRDLKPGKYRIVLTPIGPIGFSSALMETHVNLKKDASESVILIAEAQKKVEIPVELTDAFKNFDGKVMWDLSVRYPGFKDQFRQVGEFSDSKDFKRFINYLRSDGEYTIKIWDKDPSTSHPYEKTFRVAKEQQSEQDGTEKPATHPESKSEDSDKSQPQTEARPR